MARLVLVKKLVVWKTGIAVDEKILGIIDPNLTFSLLSIDPIFFTTEYFSTSISDYIY